jgi:hypothetical protein
VEVALAPEELELDPMAMTQKYEEHVREQQAQVEKEDFSDMVAEHAAKQKVRESSLGTRRESLVGSAFCSRAGPSSGQSEAELIFCCPGFLNVGNHRNSPVGCPL